MNSLVHFIDDTCIMRSVRTKDKSVQLKPHSSDLRSLMRRIFRHKLQHPPGTLHHGQINHLTIDSNRPRALRFRRLKGFHHAPGVLDLRIGRAEDRFDNLNLSGVDQRFAGEAKVTSDSRVLFQSLPDSESRYRPDLLACNPSLAAATTSTDRA